MRLDDLGKSTPLESNKSLYQKLGYDVFAVLEDHPRHHRHYYLHKRLG